MRYRGKEKKCYHLLGVSKIRSSYAVSQLRYYLRAGSKLRTDLLNLLFKRVAHCIDLNVVWRQGRNQERRGVGG